jgi:CheY-like chemotaxis protein
MSPTQPGSQRPPAPSAPAAMPDRSVPPEQSVRSAPASLGVGRCRVLIVESDVVSASALRSILTRKGCEVWTATTVAAALETLAAPLDVVLLDLVLPDGSGIEVLRRLRASGRAVRAVVTTRTDDLGQLREAEALKPDRVLRKPIDLVDLLGAIGIM